MVNKWGKPHLWRHPKGQFYIRKGSGASRVYHGPFKAEHGTKAFDLEYWSYLNGTVAASRTSWKALIASYRDSERWRRLKPRTRADYEKVLDYIIEKNGDRDMTSVSRPDVIRAMEANRDRTRFANYIAQVMSILCEHARDLGWIPANPILGVKLLKTPKERQRKHIPWTDEAVAKGRAEMALTARLILELGIGTVQRPSDLTRFTWGDFDGENLKIVQGKTGVFLMLPCTEHLKSALAEWRDQLGASPLPNQPILRSPTGSAMSYFQLARVMKTERERLGLMAYDLHALRYRGVMELAWAGCTDEEIAAYSGHMSISMIRHYAGQARQIMRARQAKAKRK